MAKDGMSKIEAEALTEKVITTLSEGEASIRLVLTKALKYKVYRPLGFRSFQTYANDCIKKAGVSFGVEYARRQAKAGLVELELEIEIGSMPEGALRSLHENVDRENCKKVFEHACESLAEGKNPTNKQIQSAAKELGCFKEQKGKKKLAKTDVSEDPIIEDDDTVSDFDADTAEAVKKNVCSIKKPLLSKVYADLTEKFELSDIKKIRTFIRAWQEAELKPIIETVIEANPKSIQMLRTKLNKFIKAAEGEANSDKLSA
jgi:hypothetical protein